VQVGCVFLRVVARGKRVDQGPADQRLRQHFQSVTRYDPKVMLLRCSHPTDLLPAHIARQHRLQNPGVLLLVGPAWKFDGLRFLEGRHCRGALLPLLALAGLTALVALVAPVAPVRGGVSKQDEWQHSRCAGV
jgi:hypothetical protein